MRIIKPIKPQNIETNVASEYELWAPEEAIPAGQYRRALDRNGIERVYYAKANNTNKNPVDNVAIWSEVKPTVSYAMFDGYVDTLTQNEELIHVKFLVSKASYLCLFGLEAEDVQIITRKDGVIIGNDALSLLIKGERDSPLAFCFGENEFRRTLIHPIPGLYKSVELEIFIKTSPGYTAKCGFCTPGWAIPIGITEWGFNVSIDDYSGNYVNDFGENAFERRPWSKPMDLDIIIPTLPDGREADRVYRQLTDLRSTPLVIDANNESTDRELLITLGYYAKVAMSSVYVGETRLSLEIKGII
ncbi:hypothetical protein [Marinomonas fungiae]|uniref:Uncharacterized protein n=1 Tax=Marinomonas fungiae TaxID=1137284 RepID=A0A0K6IJ86_9GAMM|nr:hypothetical protein [Marinomonas fungiae]CUB03165.1 hypothetical protein Ga0061065_10313 [Marinomonas fungiae]